MNREYLKEKVWLSFQTDRETSWLLKEFAHKMGMSQPEFINRICQGYIHALLADLNEIKEKSEATPNKEQN